MTVAVESVKQKTVLIDTRNSANGLTPNLDVREELSVSIFMCVVWCGGPTQIVNPNLELRLSWAVTTVHTKYFTN